MSLIGLPQGIGLISAFKEVVVNLDGQIDKHIQVLEVLMDY